jgi:hypothetical protein
LYKKLDIILDKIMLFGRSSDNKPAAPVAPAAPSFEDQLPTVISKIFQSSLKLFCFVSYENFFGNIIVLLKYVSMIASMILQVEQQQHLKYVIRHHIPLIYFILNLNRIHVLIFVWKNFLK